MRQSWTDDRLDDLNVKVDRGFAQVDQRFEAVDKRFDEVDRRFEEIDRRFEQVDARLEKVDSRLEKIEERMLEDSVSLRKEMQAMSENLHRAILQSVLGVVAVMITFMVGAFGIIATLL